MQTIIAATIAIGLVMLGLALGVLFGRPAIKGSCGGLACGGACQACPSRKETSS